MSELDSFFNNTMELFWLYLELQECKIEQEADFQDRVSIMQSDFIQELCKREKGKGIQSDI